MGDAAMGDWRSWLREQEARSPMRAERVPLRELRGWAMRDDGVAIERQGNGPYAIVGVRVHAPGRDIAEWDQPMIVRDGEGYIVLPHDPVADTFLFAAKAEPGNSPRPGCIVITAPLQSSEWNLRAGHGGKRPPRAALYDLVVERAIPWVRIPQDPGMLFGKVNSFASIPVDCAALAALPNERWFTRREAREALGDGCVSEHLVQAIALSFLSGSSQK